MKGIIFVVWEKYLGEQFGTKLLEKYRANIGETQQNLPVTTRVYPDKLLLDGLGAASKLTGMTEDRLLFEYGRYFMINGLVEYLCGYLLAQAWSAFDLLLFMREAHAQMRRTPDGLTPPLFNYDMISDDHKRVVLTYSSDRHLCSLLDGCIHGSADRFGERAHTREVLCLKRGDPVCRFEVVFEGESWAKRAAPAVIENEKQRLFKQDLTDLILQSLSFKAEEKKGLDDIKAFIEQQRGAYFPEIYKHQRHMGTIHISQIYMALAKLQQVGLVSSTANMGDAVFLDRQYWRSPTTDN